MDVLDHACHDFPHARRSLRARGVDDTLGEIGIESVSLRFVLGFLCIDIMTAMCKISFARMVSGHKDKWTRKVLGF